MLQEIQAPPKAGAQRSAVPDADRIISIPKWCEAAGISVTTGWRMVAAGTCPTITRLSPRRIGIRIRDYQAWADARRETKEARTS